MNIYNSKRIQRIKDDRYYIKLKKDIILSYNDLFTAHIQVDENGISSLLMKENNIYTKIPGFFKTKFHQCSKNKSFVRLEIKPIYELSKSIMPMTNAAYEAAYGRCEQISQKVLGIKHHDKYEHIEEYKSIIEFFIKWLKMIDRKIDRIENTIMNIY